jgi:cytochrome c oxidase assembly protein subunit 15
MNTGIRLHRFAVFTACCTFLLVIAGGLVTSTGSGLSVPDWPLSYGQLMPPMVGGVFYEHGHRMIATFVGMLTVGLAIWLWRAEERRWLRIVGLVAVGMVILQGVLGGLTVLFLLPTWISVLHATIAQSFFSLIVFIALATSEGWKEVRPDELAEASRTRSFAVAVTAMILLQLMLGAWMRHSDAGLAITDFPLSYGALVPSTSGDTLMEINDARIENGLAPVTAGQIWIHFAHRVGALLVLITVFALVRHVLLTYKNEKRLREPALVLATVVVMQALLGALTVWTGKGVQIATAHVATGALVLALSAFLTARVFRLYPLPVRSPRYSTLPSPTRS